VEVGVKFKSDIAGYIQGIRFYKSSANSGTHTVSLYTGTGTLLGRAVSSSSNESRSGWQQVDFAAPVSIAADTIYVASYHTTSGYYSVDRSYFASNFSRPPLQAVADGAFGGNGLFFYSATPRFPTTSFLGSNYWVDVVFTASGGGVPFAISNLGGTSTSTDGANTNVRVGFGVIQPSNGNDAPAGLAIFGYRANGVLVSEAAVPASPLMMSGRIYAEMNGPVNTGLAIASPHGSARINFTLTDATGKDIQTGVVTVG
jgi:hypothetical protein